MAHDYDLLVIGSGPAGEKAAVKAAYFGKRVGLVERGDVLGGACANTGTLPSKTLRESAIYYSGVKRHLYEVLTEAPRKDLTVESFLRHVRSVCDAERKRVMANLERHRVELLRGEARFEDPHTLAIRRGDETWRASAAVIAIATGSRPHRPDSIPFDGRNVFDSDTILGMDHIPRTLTVVGGGVIGSEYASIFAALGIEVHLIEGRPRMLDFLDQEVGDRLMENFRRRGIRLYLEDSVTEVKVQGDGDVLVKTAKGAELRTDSLLFSGGRNSNTDGLGLERAGVAVGKRGKLDVDEVYRTNVPHIYAVGDVIGFPALASTSMEQGRVAVGHAFALDDFKTYPILPYGIYTIPCVSTVGKTEQQAKAEGRPYVCGTASYAQSARGHILGDVHGLVKLVCERETRKVIGAHIVGERAEELIHLGQACMHFGGTIDYFLRSVFNYPTLSELYKYAAYDVLTRLAPGHRTDLDGGSPAAPRPAG